LQQQYPATRRLGNPDTAAAGDAKDLRETFQYTSNLMSSIKEEQAYASLVDSFSDCLVVAEEDLTALQITKAFTTAVQTQIDYHHTHQELYQCILDILQ